MRKAPEGGYNVITDPTMSPRLERAAAVVVSGIQTLRPNYQKEMGFHIIEDQTMIACARHDGNIYINLEMMKIIYSQNSSSRQTSIEPDDMLIAILSHEAIHVAEGHHQNKSDSETLAESIFKDLVRPFSKNNKYVEAGAKIASKLIFNTYSRGEEKRADLGSVEVLKFQKRNPLAMAAVLQLIQNNYAQPFIADFPIARWFLEHPDIQDRINWCTEMAKCR